MHILGYLMLGVIVLLWLVVVRALAESWAKFFGVLGFLAALILWVAAAIILIR